MHREVDWLRPSDRPIMVNLNSYGGWMTPSSIYLNIPYTQQHVQERCRVLHSYGLLEKYENQTVAYRLSDFGRRFLSDEISSDELNDITPAGS